MRVVIRSRLTAAIATVAAALLVAGACSAGPDPSPDPSTTASVEAPRDVLVATEPSSPTTLVASEDPAQVAVAVSRTYLAAAAIVVLAPVQDEGATARASSLGRALGAPVLLVGDANPEVDTELLRLGVEAVLTVGDVDLTGIDRTSLAIVPAPSDTADLSDLVGVDLTEIPAPGQEDATSALLALEPGEVFAATSPAEAEPEPVGELPEVGPGAQVDGSVVLFDGSSPQLGALATASAAGARVVLGAGDPRGSAETIAELSADDVISVVGVGTTMGDEEEFLVRAETARTGVHLPGGGQLLFDDKRYVALYGSPLTPALGLLGEQGTDATVERAADLAGEYAPLTEDTVVPALEIIVTVATRGAGEDGNYSRVWDSSEFLPLVEAAQSAGQYVVLDFQPGRSTFLEQIRQYEDLLAFPHVGVALDPEWRLGPDQVHLVQIGSVGIEEVNEVVTYLADFVAQRRLPQKMIILHQFRLSMITERERLDTTRTEVAVLIHADGQGPQGAKQATWRALRADAPEGVYWGWKNFVDEDSPMLTPEQTYSEVDPVPHFVSYQ